MNRKETERIIINSLLEDNSLFESASFLDATAFKFTRKEFETILSIYNKQDAVTTIDYTLSGYIREDVYDYKLGQDALILCMKLFDLHQLDVIKESIKSVRYNNLDDTLEGINKIIETVDASYSKNRKLEPIKIDKFITQLNDIRESENENGIMTQSFPTLNRITGGMLPTDLVGIYGKEKSSKTTFAHQIIIDIALSNKIPCAVFNFEMDVMQLLMKTMSMVTEIDTNILRNPHQNHFPDSEFEIKTDKLKNKFSNTNLYIIDNMLNEYQIYSKTKEMIKQSGIKIVVVDYLMLMESNRKFSQRRDELNYLSRFFKRMAKKLNIIIILISQANDSGMREAEAKGLSRDANYYFYVEALEQGKEVRIGGSKYKAKEGDYIIINRGIRHGIGNRAFITRFQNNRYGEVSIDIEQNTRMIGELPF